MRARRARAARARYEGEAMVAKVGGVFGTLTYPHLILRIDFIGLDLEKHPPMENAIKIVKWSGTFTAKLKLP